MSEPPMGFDAWLPRAPADWRRYEPPEGSTVECMKGEHSPRPPAAFLRLSDLGLFCARCAEAAGMTSTNVAAHGAPPVRTECGASAGFYAQASAAMDAARDAAAASFSREVYGGTLPDWNLPPAPPEPLLATLKRWHWRVRERIANAIYPRPELEYDE